MGVSSLLPIVDLRDQIHTISLGSKRLNLLSPLSYPKCFYKIFSPNTLSHINMENKYMSALSVFLKLFCFRFVFCLFVFLGFFTKYFYYLGISHNAPQSHIPVLPGPPPRRRRALRPISTSMVTSVLWPSRGILFWNCIARKS